MKELFSCLEQSLLAGEDVVLVTIIASSGSTPRGAGAKMLVSAQGWMAGTVGGGAVEHRCIQIARELAGSAHPVQNSFALNQDDNAELGMICGGQVEVHFLPVGAGDAHTLALCRDAAEYLAAGTPFWLLTPMQDGTCLSLLTRHGREGDLPAELAGQLSAEPHIHTASGKRWFVEPLLQPGTVYLFGGGHVAQALVPVLAPLHFPCTVLEDRAEFADPALFPLAGNVYLVNFSDAAAYTGISRDDYVCIMTRGHQNDLLVQQRALRTPARYIGLIGSARKAAASFASLRQMGFSERDLSRIVTPIGLPIGGDAPEEIAISIAAQLIQYRSGARGDRFTGEGPV